MLAEPLSATDAERLGLVARVVRTADLLAESMAVARRLAVAAPVALALTKQALEQGWAASFEEQLETEAVLQGRAGTTADHAEGLAAFIERRPPRFTGR